MKPIAIITSLLCLLCFSVTESTAQDFHYSQYYHAPLRINPALTGIFGGDVRFSGQYRSQWTSVPVDYKTFSLSVDKKWLERTDGNGFWSTGLAINHDRAGDSRLGWTDADLNASYTKYLDQRTFITVGGQLALVQRRFDRDDLRFDNQYDPGRGVYDPTLDNGENFARTSHVFADLSAGVNLRLQALQRTSLVDRLDRRSKLDLGVGFYHLTRPDQSFTDEAEVPLPVRISPYAMGVLQLGGTLDLVGAFTWQMQQEYEEKVGMAGLRAHLSRQLGNQVSLLLGAGYRFNDFGDAWYPTLELNYNSWEVGLSYDINVSPFNVATQKRGGPEVSVRYIIKKIRPLPEFKMCPLI